MRCKIFLVSVLLLVLSVNSVSAKTDLKVDFARGQVFYKSEGCPPFSLQPGKLGWNEGLTILSFYDGQCFVKNSSQVEFRLKEDSLIFFKDQNSCEVRKGLIGIRADVGETINIATAHALLEIENATVIIKTCPALTRICVIKGAAMLKNLKYCQKTPLKAGHEVAAGSGMYSKFYAFTNELRYAWYWVEAAKEPSLQLE